MAPLVLPNQGSHPQLNYQEKCAEAYIYFITFVQLRIQAQCPKESAKALLRVIHVLCNHSAIMSLNVRTHS